MRLLFFSYVFLLPFFSSPYLYSFFRSWSINFSLFPILGIFLIFLLRLLRVGSLPRPLYGVQKTSNFFAAIQIYSVIVTVIASLVLELMAFQTNDFYRGPAFNSMKELLRAFLTFIAFYLVVLQLKTVSDVRKFLRITHVSLACLAVYGYVQMISVVLPNSLPHTLLAVISPMLDQGWAGTSRENHLYIDWLKRINLITPEASTAAQILEVYFLPLLLASRLSNFSVWKQRILGMSVEMFLTLAIVPLIFATLSSVGLICFFMMIIICFVFTANNLKRLIFLVSSVGIAGVVIIALISSYGILDLVWFMLTKVGDTSNGSTNTRYALLDSSFKLFLHNPWGVGTNNNSVLMAQYIPDWAKSNPEIVNAIANENLPTLNIWSDILSSTGLIGFFMFLIFIAMLWRKNVDFKAVGSEKFKHYAFIIFIFAFTVHGFSTSATTFFWMWGIFGFYAVLGNFDKNELDEIFSERECLKNGELEVAVEK